MRNYGFCCLRFLLAMAILPASAKAQNEQTGKIVFKSNSELVLVPVTVTNRHGAAVTGLSQNQFHIEENKVIQRISAISERDVPVSVGIVLDVSGSMRDVLPFAKHALKDFLDSANPEDEAFLYTVSSSPRRESSFTAEFQSILSGVSFRAAYGSTALIDTIYMSIDELHKAKQNRRALLVISDGMDNHSRYSKAQLLSRALESDEQIYTISIRNSSIDKKPIQLTEEHAGLNLLDGLAWQTGGIPFIVRDGAALHQATDQIGHVLRSQYVLSYVPQHRERNGKWHSIKVTVAVPHAMVYARSGYKAN